MSYGFIPHSLVRQGLVDGFRCPISGREFVKVNATRAEIDALLQEQQTYTASLMLALDGGEPKVRTLEERRQQWLIEHGGASGSN